MNRPRGRQGRRHSLPAIHSTLGFSRVVPEGSDTFQQALEDLYSNEPSHAPPKVICEATLNRLGNIQEGDEEDEVEDDETDAIEEVRRMNRRYSSPVVLSQDDIDALRSKGPSGSKKGHVEKNLKMFTNASKEYFIKHGHWPSHHSVGGTKKGASLNHHSASSGVAFGSHSSKPSKLKT